MDKDTALEEQLFKVAEETRKVTDRWNKEAISLSCESSLWLGESARLREESERLRQVARRMQEKSVLLRDDCTTIQRLQEESSLERLCCLLQQNDPRISTLNLERLRSILPGNSTEAIGTALKGNTHITSLTLTASIVDHVDTELPRRKATPCIDYIRTSNSLRHVALKNGLPDERLTSEILIAIATNTGDCLASNGLSLSNGHY
jgi:hypothetical protein